MTQPTQEDRYDILTELLQWEYIPEYHFGGNEYADAYKAPCGDIYAEEEVPDPYTDDSFTGALVKAVFPLLAEQMWFIEIFEDGIYIQRYRKWEAENVLKAPNLSTALIEAYKKIEGEKT